MAVVGLGNHPQKEGVGNLVIDIPWPRSQRHNPVALVSLGGEWVGAEGMSSTEPTLTMTSSGGHWISQYSTRSLPNWQNLTLTTAATIWTGKTSQTSTDGRTIVRSPLLTAKKTGIRTRTSSFFQRIPQAWDCPLTPSNQWEQHWGLISPLDFYALYPNFLPRRKEGLWDCGPFQLIQWGLTMPPQL